MRQVESLSHTRWECKYHIVFIPKYRRKQLFGQIRKELGEVFHRLARQKEGLIEEGHIMPDHVHMMISIPPKYAVSQIVGFIKREECDLHCTHVSGPEEELCRPEFLGERVFCLDRGPGRAGEREYIRHQEAEDRRIDQLQLT